jgi:hypothetical protein
MDARVVDETWFDYVFTNIRVGWDYKLSRSFLEVEAGIHKSERSIFVDYFNLWKYNYR